MISVSPRHKAIVSFAILVTFVLLFAGYIRPAFGQSVNVVLTTPDQTSLLAPQTPLTFASGTAAQLAINIDDTITYQRLEGVGGSFTDSSAYLVWTKLTPAQRNQLMNDLFNQQGIRLSFLRQPMGASDFAVNGNYSYDDVPTGQTDPTLTNFSISHDTAYIIPLLAQARTINPAVKIVAVPWSPPAWMKTNGSMKGGNMITADFPSFAQYFVKFLQAYQQQGIPIYAISVQNEPLNSTNSYPSELLTATDQSDFIASHLGPALNIAGLTETKIFGYEHNWDNTGYPETILGSAAGNFLAGTAFHCYAGDVSAQSTVQTAYPGKGLWFTECSGTVGSNFAGDLVWNSQHLLIGATRNWARSVSLWNLALDQDSGPKNGGCPDCRGVVTIDTTTTPSTIMRNVEYYVLGHLGKFVVPGAVRIASNTFGAGSIEDVAFQNPDGSIVLVALNSSSSTQAFTVNWQIKTFNYSLPAQSVATFEWK